ncbi:MAG TPA: glycosyltransferase family 2 protein [Opitutaceae bacterium]|nr:glycosyltransferase family 2 protein [Opitutaceae bacterium]
MITMNEERAVAGVIGDIRAVAPAAEIVLVDSSKDRTAEIAASLGARVIKQFPPKGYGPAMDRVLRSAEGEVIVTLDCDGSYPAAMIPVLARQVSEEGWDLVDGARVGLGGKPAAMPWMNYLANIGFGLVASAMFFRWLPDLHSGMRAYRRSLIQQLKYDPKGAALPVELLTRSVKNGARVKVVPIDYHERIGTSTMRPLQSAWWTLKRLLGVRFS